MIRRVISTITAALGAILIAISCTTAGKPSNVSAIPSSVESQLASGAPVYNHTCATSTCHGTQGEGIQSGDGFKVWPLVGDEFQSRHPNAQIIFDVIRSGDEPHLRALTDQQIYNAISYELSQNQIALESPLAADNAFRTFGGSMSGQAQGGLFPPSDDATLIDLPPTHELPISAQSDQLRLQIDQIATASVIGKTKLTNGGVFLIVVFVLADLDPAPMTVNPAYLWLSTTGGDRLAPRSVNIHSAIEQFHKQSIQPQHGTAALVVFVLSDAR